ncbi:uncharacterized protein NPIL_398771 [Nephila pilipes]|uniref:Uncharacterized protein n=1 Tax=Nephila pilipes TaxID=299642 RepID=A0A8X6NHP3_NEPPI|nr:uncharacterized protein NPIL_398771 [Nephila pilipes]
MAHGGDVNIFPLELVKDIQIKNFSVVDKCKDAREYFVVRGDEFPAIFCVTVYPNGLSSKYQESISVQFFKVLIDRDTSPYIQKHNVSWTLSIIDFNGDGHFYQSFSKDNVTGFPYNLVVTDFKKRSTVLEDADSLLLRDVLTVRCEFFCVSEMYVTKETLLGEHWLLTYNRVWAECIWNNVDGISSVENFDGFDDFYTIFAIRLNLEYDEDDTYGGVSLCRQMDTIIGTFLKILVTYVSYMNLTDLDSQLDAWAETVSTDKCRETYLKCNCIFHAYILIKEELRNEYKYHFSGKDLESCYHFFKKWFSIPLAKRRGLLVSHLNLRENYHESTMNDFDKLSLLAKKERSIVEEVIAKNMNILHFNNYEDGWNCIIDAMVYFLFDEDKLDIFENIIKYPIDKKMVNPVDIDSQMHLLYFLHNGDIKTESINELSKLYKLAHIHSVKNLMHLCSERMRPSVSQNAVSSLRKLFNHNDDNLWNMVKSFENLNKNE